MKLYIDISKKSNWNQFIIENNGSFLQSFEWGRFQESLGNKVFFLQVTEEDSTLAQALVIKHRFPLGFKGYLYVPYGPCFCQGISLSQQQEALGLLFRTLKTIAREEKAVFLRLEPLQPLSLPPGLPSALPPVRIQPRKTLVLDLKRPEQEILDDFPKHTRYSIRIAEKNDVKGEFKNEYLSAFHELLRKTAKRGNFKPHPEPHYRAFFQVISEDFKVKMCLARHQERVIAASIVVLFGRRATYLHAASDKDFGALQGSSFLMAEQIKLAKRLGCLEYDFWGIDERKWPGVTHFKKSFGGQELKYPQGRDIVFQKVWYKTYKAYRTYF